MTPYDLLCDDATARINDNCYDRWEGTSKVMYFVGDDEFARAMFELRVDLELIEKRKK